MTNEPGISICRNFSFKLALTGTACAGVVKRNVMITAEIPPIGRLTVDTKGLAFVFMDRVWEDDETCL